ncbi:probable RNA-binding protein 18 [Xenopus laevis]|uniref:Probable RNA-binding protein 18 n=1 Tax=Xenopus laevis TaxID=8355 RepID=A0A8J1LNJ6_XENLA|nr:probable RNA-binding protein 18 [Xenopus laevis]
MCAAWPHSCWGLVPFASCLPRHMPLGGRGNRCCLAQAFTNCTARPPFQQILPGTVPLHPGHKPSNSLKQEQRPGWRRYDNYKSEKVLPISLEPSSSTEPTQSTLSVSTKIKAIEAKLKMMAENPDPLLPGQSSYSYFKANEKKKITPYHKSSLKSKR